MTALRIASLNSGEIVKAGYGDFLTPCAFLGFTSQMDAYSRTPLFSCIKTLKEMTGTRNAAQLEQLQDEAGPGHSFYALFRDLEDGCVWAAYLWKGAWRVGSSAHTLRLAA